MKRVLVIGLLFLIATTVWTIPGDLDRNGKVDFEDFFLFADQFGKEGAPDTLQVSISDTVVVTKTDTVRLTQRDTVMVTRTDTFTVTQLDTVFITERDTVTVTRTDTVTQTFRDTFTTTVRDTVFVGTDVRPPVQSWTAVANDMESAIYWLGITHSTASSTVFIGTGFAVAPYVIATNAHVILALENWASSLENRGLSPLRIAIRARTFAYSGGTYLLSQGGLYGSDYDLTVNSADVAISLVSPTSGPFPYYVDIAPREAILAISSGDAVATLGFPGELERETQDIALQPIPTFKTGTVSALRPYKSITLSWIMTNKIVQHNLDLTPGTSGSPIFNQHGEVVAVNNAGFTGTDLDFAIRGDELRDLLEAAKIEFPSLYENIRFKPVAIQRGLDKRSITDLVGDDVHQRDESQLREWLLERGWQGF